MDRAWCLESEAFRLEMLEQMEGKLGENHPGDLRHETSAARAERIITEELARLGWSDNYLVERRKADPAKLDIAARLRKETTPVFQRQPRFVPTAPMAWRTPALRIKSQLDRVTPKI